ncbi:MAG: hypothetical protein NT091_04805, partial [Candidatus Falkowbacteria bacterium]|nr:hypothetical protein [Candidatus Falkowbacteria bacterium]
MIISNPNAQKYLNFGPTAGTTGFGFRSNAGVLEFKNSSGAWDQFSGATVDKASKVIVGTNHGFAVGDIVRASTTAAGKYTKAQADSSSNAEVIGIVSATSTNDFTLTTGGYVDLSASTTLAFNSGDNYYLATSTAGALTNIEPTGAGEVSKPVFVATGAKTGYLINYRGNLQLGATASAGIGVAGNLAYYSATNTIGSTNNLVIDGTGVGIGTSSVTTGYRLDVNGNVHVNGAVNSNDLAVTNVI